MILIQYFYNKNPIKNPIDNLWMLKNPIENPIDIFKMSKIQLIKKMVKHPIENPIDI